MSEEKEAHTEDKPQTTLSLDEFLDRYCDKEDTTMKSLGEAFSKAGLAIVGVMVLLVIVRFSLNFDFSYVPILGPFLIENFLLVAILGTVIGIVLLSVGIKISKEDRRKKEENPPKERVLRSFLRQLYRRGFFPDDMGNDEFSCAIESLGTRTYRIDFTIDKPENEVREASIEALRALGCRFGENFNDHRGYVQFRDQWRYSVTFSLQSIDKAF